MGLASINNGVIFFLGFIFCPLASAINPKVLKKFCLI